MKQIKIQAKANTPNRVKTIGLLALGVVSVIGIGMYFSTGGDFSFSNPKAAFLCDYGVYFKGYCTNNKKCPSPIHYQCYKTAIKDPDYERCVKRSAIADVIYDCKLRAAPPTPTPTEICDYGSYPKGTCANKVCNINPVDVILGYTTCEEYSIAGAQQKKCLARATGGVYEEIYDCKTTRPGPSPEPSDTPKPTTTPPVAKCTNPGKCETIARCGAGGGYVINGKCGTGEVCCRY